MRFLKDFLLKMTKAKRLTKKQERLFETLHFIIRFLVLSIPLYLILWLNPAMDAIQYVVADHASWALEALSFPVIRDGLVLSVGSGVPFLVYIGPDCIGWKSALCFIALVLASLGVSMRKRVLGLAIGIPVIYLGNLLRIIVVVLVERSFGLDAALLVHDWLWQAGLIALVLAAWLVWLRSEHVAAVFSRLLGRAAKKGKKGN